MPTPQHSRATVDVATQLGGPELRADGRRTARRPGRHPWTSLLVVMATGLLVGVCTQVLQGVLPDEWGVLANSGVMWALTAFALGMVLPGLASAAAGGAAELVIAAVVYYLAVDWFEGTSSDARSAIIWSVAGVVAGPVFAVAGHLCVRRVALRPHALALIAGVLGGEGVHLTWLVDNAALRPAGIVELAIAGAILATCAVRAARTSTTPHVDRLAVAGVAAAAASITLIAMALIDATFRAV